MVSCRQREHQAPSTLHGVVGTHTHCSDTCACWRRIPKPRRTASMMPGSSWPSIKQAFVNPQKALFGDRAQTGT
eukprot:12345088-Prorocentrum_lima.AAC.1